MASIIFKTEKKESSFKQQDLSPLQIILIHLLRENGPMTRDQICEELGFGKHSIVKINPCIAKRYKSNRYVFEQYNKRTTIHDNIVKLQKRNLVVKYSKNNGKRGRPQVFYKYLENGNESR